jgi:hypothetical protein
VCSLLVVSSRFHLGLIIRMKIETAQPRSCAVLTRICTFWCLLEDGGEPYCSFNHASS